MDNRSLVIDPPQNEFGKDYRKIGQLIQRRFTVAKKWSHSSGMGGHFVPEWVVSLQRNRWTVCSGMSGHFAAEYANPLLERKRFAPDTSLFSFRS
jgi:hypothetical protein